MAKKKDLYSLVIIPNEVLYCKRLTKGAKLLYIEIVKECKKRGYCRLTNIHFSKLLKTSTTSISKWMNELRKNKIIKYSCKYIKTRNKNIRTIYLKKISKETEKAYSKIVDSIDNFPSLESDKHSKHGWIYLIRYDKFFKIGITRQKNPINRIEAYDLHNPFPKEIIFCKLISNCWKTEKEIKEYFSEKTATNSQEWFILTKTDIKKIKRLVKKAENKLKDTFKKSLDIPLSKVNNISYKDIDRDESDIESDSSRSNFNIFENNIKDDFDIKTKEWTDERGQKYGEDTIDYES